MKTNYMSKLVMILMVILTFQAKIFSQDTFSIVAVDTITGEIGSAGASCIAGSFILSDVIEGMRGYIFILAAFLIMLLFWNENTSFWVVVLAFMFVGVGIGLSGTPASRSLTGSVPVMKAGMASGTADLQRDLGGAMFNSLFGALLAAGYAAAMNAAIAAAPEGTQVPATVTNSLIMSYAGAQSVAAANIHSMPARSLQPPNSPSWPVTSRPSSPGSSPS